MARLCDIPEELASPLEEDLAFSGQAHASRGAMKQARTDRPLETGDGVGHTWPRHPLRFSGTGEAPIRIFKLEEIQAAHRFLESNEQIGKIVVNT